MSDDILATIDNALDDYDLSVDAMRWTPEPVGALGVSPDFVIIDEGQEIRTWGGDLIRRVTRPAVTAPFVTWAPGTWVQPTHTAPPDISAIVDQLLEGWGVDDPNFRRVYLQEWTAAP